MNAAEERNLLTRKAKALRAVLRQMVMAPTRGTFVHCASQRAHGAAEFKLEASIQRMMMK